MKLGQTFALYLYFCSHLWLFFVFHSAACFHITALSVEFRSQSLQAGWRTETFTRRCKSLLSIWHLMKQDSEPHLPFQLHWSLEYWQKESRQRRRRGSREASIGASMFVSQLTSLLLGWNYDQIRRRISSCIAFPCAPSPLRAAPRCVLFESRVVQINKGAYSNSSVATPVPTALRKMCAEFSSDSVSAALIALHVTPLPRFVTFAAFKCSAEALISELHCIKRLLCSIGVLLAFGNLVIVFYP